MTAEGVGLPPSKRPRPGWHSYRLPDWFAREVRQQVRTRIVAALRRRAGSEGAPVPALVAPPPGLLSAEARP